MSDKENPDAYEGVSEIVTELQKAGAPQSQIDNAIQMAKDAPEQPGAGIPYQYPPEPEVNTVDAESEG